MAKAARATDQALERNFDRLQIRIRNGVMEPFLTPTHESPKADKVFWRRALITAARDHERKRALATAAYRRKVTLAADRALRLVDALRRDATMTDLVPAVETVEKRLRSMAKRRRGGDPVVSLIDYLIDVEGFPRTRAYRVLSEVVFNIPETTLRARHEKALRARR